jgi:hypothetical protein
MATVGEILASRYQERARVTDPELVRRYEQAIDDIRMGVCDGVTAAKKYNLNYYTLIGLKKKILGWKPRPGGKNARKYKARKAAAARWERRKVFDSNRSPAKLATLEKERAVLAAKVAAKKGEQPLTNGGVDPAKFVLDLRRLLLNTRLSPVEANQVCFTVLEAMVQK